MSDKQLGLNTLAPAPGHKTDRRRVGRGIGSGLGKTCGRGHKGQTSRAGGKVRPGFEGGQMPLQKRLPKFGFKSRVSQITAQIRTGELDSVGGEVINIDSLRSAGIFGGVIKRAKIFLSGEVTKPYIIQGVALTAGAKQAIEKAGGRVEA